MARLADSTLRHTLNAGDPERTESVGAYRIVRRLAVGGMAEIFLARQRGLEGLERTVVIKRILERFAHDDEFVTMFLDEARLMAALSHPHIAQVFDLGRVDETYYLVMEYVRGPTLGTLLSAASSSPRGVLPIGAALGIGLAMAEALQYVHTRPDELGRPLNIVHRDLNPSNVILGYNGSVKLIDFGIAKAATKVYETRTGVVKGTYGYIAPEQLSGRKKVDHRADVFALGILLYEMAVGKHPFDVSQEPNLIDRILHARYLRPRELRPDIPDDLDDLIARCLDPQPEGRPADMGDLIRSLAGHLGRRGIVPTSTGLAQVTRSLVPDDEGPRPLPRLTSPFQPIRFGGREGTPAKGDRAMPYTADQAHPASGAAVSLSQPDDDDDDDDIPTRVHVTPAYEPPHAAAKTGLADGGNPAPSGAAQPRAATPHLGVEAVDHREPDRSDPRAIADARYQRDTRVEPPASLERTSHAALGWVLLILVCTGVAFGAFWATQHLGARNGELERETMWAGGVRAALPAEPRLGRAEEHRTLRVVSAPAGAAVYVDRAARRAGRTPLTLTLDRETERVWLRLTLHGYLDEQREVRPQIGEARFTMRPARSSERSARAGERAVQGTEPLQVQ